MKFRCGYGVVGLIQRWRVLRLLMMAAAVVHDEKLYFDVALKLVKEAGEVIKYAFGQPVNVMTKASIRDLVTETDTRVEKMLFDGLRAHFPDHKFIGEESTAASENKGLLEWTDDPTWIIDPIDGTTNFVHKCPHVCVSVGLTIKRQVVAGIVYNPVLNELFYARHGHGAYKNGFPIKASSTKTIDTSIIAASLGVHNLVDFANATDVATDNMKKLIADGSQGTRNLGAAALHLCYVADGCFDAMVEYGLHAWDMAGGAVILREAGGVCINPIDGGDLQLMGKGIIAAGTPELAQKLQKSLTHLNHKPEGPLV